MASRSRSDNEAARSGSAEVVDRLRRDILAGRLTDGQRLTEANLVERFGVGRGPVREAMRDLAAQGLVLSRPNRGAVVSPEAPKPIRDLIVPIRRTVETYALGLIFDDLTDEDFKAWDQLLVRMRTACRAEDFHEIAELDIAFHRSLVERSGQPDLILIWDTLVGRIRNHFRRTQRRCRNLMAIYDEHRAIVECFREGTLEDAQRLLAEKID